MLRATFELLALLLVASLSPGVHRCRGRQRVPTQLQVCGLAETRQPGEGLQCGGESFAPTFHGQWIDQRQINPRCFKYLLPLSRDIKLA